MKPYNDALPSFIEKKEEWIQSLSYFLEGRIVW